MSGAKKAAKKITSKIVDPIMKGVRWSVETSTKPLKNAMKSMQPDMPDQAAAPLMPDYEAIEKDRRRRRTSKMGRTETIMSDSLG